MIARAFDMSGSFHGKDGLGKRRNLIRKIFRFIIFQSSGF